MMNHDHDDDSPDLHFAIIKVSEALTGIPDWHRIVGRCIADHIRRERVNLNRLKPGTGLHFEVRIVDEVGHA